MVTTPEFRATKKALREMRDAGGRLLMQDGRIWVEGADDTAVLACMAEIERALIPQVTRDDQRLVDEAFAALGGPKIKYISDDATARAEIENLLEAEIITVDLETAVLAEWQMPVQVLLNQADHA